MGGQFPMCCNMADNRPKLMSKKNNKCSTKKKIEMEKVVEQILPSMGKGTCTDYDIPFEQLDIQAENRKEPKRYCESSERNSESKLKSHPDEPDMQIDNK